MEPLTSTPLIWANLMNFPDRSSRASPVSPNRVFTSPIAVPAVAKSVGIDVARFFTLFCMSSRASPDAPVFVMTVSIASSTSLKAAIPAAPTAMIGAVTCVVSVVPTPVTLSPMFFSWAPHSFSCAECVVSCSLTSFRLPWYLFSCAWTSLISASFFWIAAASASSLFFSISSCAFRIRSLSS